MSRQDKATTEKHTRTLRELVKRPENKVCADCKRNDPRWASWNIGVFVCIRCSGIHRSMGTHISKVKSVDLDVWTPEQMASITKWGNRRANLYWEAHLKAGHIPPEHKMESFIRSKYESKRWAMEGAPPSDPSILEDGSSAPSPSHSHLAAGTPPPSGALTPPVTTTTTTTSTTSSRPPHALLSTAAASRTRTHVSQNSSARASPQPIQQQQQAAPPPAEASLFDLDFHAPTQTQSQSQATGQPQSHMTGGAVPAAKDVKSDILSLFSTPAANPVQQPQVQAHAQMGFSGFGGGMGGMGAGAPTASAPITSMQGNSGTGMWGVQSGWTGASAGAPAASSNDLWGNFGSATQPAAQTSLFQTQNAWATPAPSAIPPGMAGGNVWASSGTSTTSAAGSGDLFSSPFSSTSATTQKKEDAFGDLWSSFK